MTIDERLHDSAKRRDRYEAIAENIDRSGRHVPDSVAEQLLWAQIDYAVAKDDRHDPWMKD
jgi:hypothetical protein